MNKVLFVTGAVRDGARVLIIDDVATTMGTKFDILGQLTAEAIHRGHSYFPAGVALFLDREQTTALYDSKGQTILNEKGQNAIKNFKLKTGLEVQTILGIRETVDYLKKEGVHVLQRGHMAPLSQETVEELYAYLDVYGI